MIASNFPQAIAYVLASEGGFVNNPADPGGATNLGITIATLRAYRGRAVSVDDVRKLGKDEAGAIYRAHYWDAVKADQLPFAVQLAVLDLLGRRRFDFVTRQVLGKPVLTRLRLLSSRVFADCLLGADFGLRFVNRLSQARGRIRRRVVISEIDAKLIRVFQIPLAAMTERALQEFGEG